MLLENGIVNAVYFMDNLVDKTKVVLKEPHMFLNSRQAFLYSIVRFVVDWFGKKKRKYS